MRKFVSSIFHTMSITTKAIGLIERKITKTAHVLDIRTWEKNTFHEIDLHVPGADFSKTAGVQHMKCRVAPLTYREYTIAKWDAETCTCTLFIDAPHEGPGSVWVRSLAPGSIVSYLHIEAHKYPIEAERPSLFLGDQSAIGHFLALQQLAGNDATIDGAITIKKTVHRKAMADYFPELHVQPIDPEISSTGALLHWLDKCKDKQDHNIYLAGNSYMVAAVRKQLKKNGHPAGQIKAQGFWR